MTILYYVVALLFAAGVVTASLLIKRKNPSKLQILFKAIGFAIATALFFRYMTGKDVIMSVSNFTVDFGFSSKGWIVLALIQVWLAYAVEMLLILAPFFKVKTLPALVTFFGGVGFVLNTIFLKNHVHAIVGVTAFESFSFRALLMALETGLGLGLVAVYAWENRKQILLKGTEWVNFALAIVGMILATIQSYFPQVVMDIGKYGMIPIDLNYYHRLYIYPAVIIPLALYGFFHNKSEQTKRFAILYYAWSSLIMFSYVRRFGDLTGPNWVTSLPLHLCNTALYVTPLCLTLKLKKLFYFTYFINVFGALAALALPNVELPVLNRDMVEFFMAHYQAFFMPLLIVALGLFPRPRWKQFTYSMTAFVIYFVAILFINAWFSNYDPSVDYFFLNSTFIPDKFGTWAIGLLNFVWEFDIGTLHFKFYPIYQAIFFLVYYAVAFAMWFVYELGFNVASGFHDIASRKQKIKADFLALQVQMAGRSLEEPLSMENVNKLVLKNFTKRYAKSDVYAVKDANLEVCGGEIFGFLGPNGAGKSTIIKSIVGIQTITEGAIEVCGYDVATQSVMAKRQIGFVPDHYALYEKLTAREYINYIADLYQVSKEDRDTRLARFIEIFEFQSAIDNQIKTYSHGMKQKVTIMSALIHNPKVWILDEPLTGLDPNSIFQVKECMKEHARQGNIVFFSSHIIDVVERICDKIAIIRKGQIQCVRDVHEMEDNEESLEAFYMQTINGYEVDPIAVKEG